MLIRLKSNVPLPFVTRGAFDISIGHDFVPITDDVAAWMLETYPGHYETPEAAKEAAVASLAEAAHASEMKAAVEAAAIAKALEESESQVKAELEARLMAELEAEEKAGKAKSKKAADKPQG